MLEKTLKKLDDIAAQAMSQYAEATDKTHKDQLLSLALKALTKKGKILGDSGFFPNTGN